MPRFCMFCCCQIPRSNEGKEWFFYTDQSVTLELLEGNTFGNALKLVVV